MGNKWLPGLQLFNFFQLKTSLSSRYFEINDILAQIFLEREQHHDEISRPCWNKKEGTGKDYATKFARKIRKEKGNSLLHVLCVKAGCKLATYFSENPQSGVC